MALTAGSPTDTAASVDVTAPTSGPTDGWASYLVSLCPKDSSCQDLEPCTKAPEGDTTTCTLPTLAHFTQYTVKVVAANGAVLSTEGSVTFTTRIS